MARAAHYDGSGVVVAGRGAAARGAAFWLWFAARGHCSSEGNGSTAQGVLGAGQAVLDVVRVRVRRKVEAGDGAAAVRLTAVPIADVAWRSAAGRRESRRRKKVEATVVVEEGQRSGGLELYTSAS